MGCTLWLLLNLLVLGVALCDDGSPVITVVQGSLRGRKVTPDNLAPYYSFLGIPYGKPPVRDLRFKAPMAAESWNGTLEATKEGHICTQPDSTLTSVIGDEDCLYLNVYTPELSDSKALRPVMVWIHGGGYLQGSGNEQQQGPEFLINAGIVYVSLNYRLGIFGFLSTEDAVVPGNAGLKDQVLALRWVQQNIAAFGGDPKQVTIFGESAGAASVNYHMLSPMSGGLFRSAIAESGSTSSAWALAEKPRKNAFLVGAALGFNGDSSQELVDFLRSVSADDLLTTSLATVNDEDRYRIVRMCHELPFVEPMVEGEEAFITENPLILLEEGKFHNVPYLTGVNSAEGLHSTAFLLGDGRSFQEIDEDFPKVFKPELRYCKEESCGDIMVDQIKSFYFGGKPLSNDTVENLIDMLTDIFFAEGSFHAAKKMSAKSSAPVYFYHFTYDGSLAFGKLTDPAMVNLGNTSGVTHGDELGYIFEFGVQVPDDSEAARVRSRMVILWTNFAKTGNPTPDVTEEIPKWLPYTGGGADFLDIGAHLQPKRDFHKSRMDFWEKLYSYRSNFNK